MEKNNNQKTKNNNQKPKNNNQKPKNNNQKTENNNQKPEKSQKIDWKKKLKLVIPVGVGIGLGGFGAREAINYYESTNTIKDTARKTDNSDLYDLEYRNLLDRFFNSNDDIQLQCGKASEELIQLIKDLDYNQKYLDKNVARERNNELGRKIAMEGINIFKGRVVDLINESEERNEENLLTTDDIYIQFSQGSLFEPKNFYKVTDTEGKDLGYVIQDKNVVKTLNELSEPQINESLNIEDNLIRKYLQDICDYLIMCQMVPEKRMDGIYKKIECRPVKTIENNKSGEMNRANGKEDDEAETIAGAHVELNTEDGTISVDFNGEEPSEEQYVDYEGYDEDR